MLVTEQMSHDEKYFGTREAIILYNLIFHFISINFSSMIIKFLITNSWIFLSASGDRFAFSV